MNHILAVIYDIFLIQFDQQHPDCITARLVESYHLNGSCLIKSS